MKFPDYKYVSFAPKRDRRRKVIHINELPGHVGEEECFSSYLRYPVEYFEFWEKNNGSLKGYSGSCYSDVVPIDLDSSEDLNDALRDCRGLIGELESQYGVNPNSLVLYFSGSKGFHVEIPIVLFGDIQPSSSLPYIFKEIANSFNIQSLDPSIYHRNAIWRISNTINTNSGLYKIPLSIHQINTSKIDEIQTLARVPNTSYNPINYEDWNVVPEMAEIWAQAEEKLGDNRKPAKEYIFNDNSQNRAVYHDGVQEGNRNNRAFEIARELKGKGWKINEVKEYLVKDWNIKNNPPEKNIQSLYNTVESVYSSSIEDSGSVAVIRHLRTDPYYNSMKAIHRAIYVDILCNLNEVRKIVWQKYTCNVNQLIYSHKSIASRVGVSEHQVRTVIKKLEEWGRVTVDILKDGEKVACSRLTFICFESQAKAQANPRREVENNHRLSNNYYHNSRER